MIRVIYTPEIFTLQEVGGISRYFTQALRHWPKEIARPRVIAGMHSNQYLRRESGVAGFYASRGQTLRLKVNKALCRCVAGLHPHDIVHQTYYSEQKYPSSHPLVITVYDLIDEILSRFTHRCSAWP